ncbi:hypothetical protein RHSIM_RhsimUnG0201100 [Rhododendron simsii]|uniref:Uncharacterized protein n=1 Tax=Rhododendron simsii TaxID=118357 RepID=A0A834FU18_RHOSS|nr:hypothetical protein RHSIM_RhsimUnG0201100 [Rhododendron simsii]
MMLVLSRKRLESVLVISFTIATILFALPREYKEDETGGGGAKSPVPTVIFNTLPPSTFHLFGPMMLVLSRKRLESVLVTSFTIATILFALPREYKEDETGGGGAKSPVPTVIFNTLPPSTFHLFGPMMLVLPRKRLESVLVTSFTIATILFALPREYKEDETGGGGAKSPVPTVIFNTLPPSTFHLFGPMMLVLSRKRLESVLVTSFTIATILFTLPREYKEDETGGGGAKSPVPTVIFNTLPPSTFHLFGPMMLVLSRKRLESVLVTSFTIATILFALPREYKEDETGGGGAKSPVPIVIFNTLPPSTFHLFGPMMLVLSRKRLESVLVTSFTIATILFVLPREYKEDETRGGGAKSPVPTVIFNTLPPSTFHLFGPMMLVLSRKRLESVLVTSFTIATILFALPREYKEDETGGGGAKSPIPTVIFNTLPPYTFRLFVLSLIFAFSFSLSALLIHDSSCSDHNTTSTTAANNKISGFSHQHLVNFFGCSSLASIATALAILFRALLLTRAILFRALLLTATEAYSSSSPSSAPTTVLCGSCSNAGAVFIRSGDYVVQLRAVQPPARPCRHQSDDRRRSLATTMIAVIILMAAAMSTANAGCTLPQGTNGSHEVLIPGQSSIPCDVLTTPPSVTADRAPLDVVDAGGQDDDSYGGGDYQATAAGIHRNDCIAEFPPHHVDVPAVTGEISSSTDQIRTEERVEDNDEKDSFKFGNTMALMVSSLQPRGNLSSLATWSRSWSPSWSTSSPPPTSSWSPSASFPVTVARLAVVFGFAASLIGSMMLRRGHQTAANFFRHAGYFSGAVAFFSMTYMFVPDHLAWAVLAVAGVLALVFAYSLGEIL